MAQVTILINYVEINLSAVADASRVFIMTASGQRGCHKMVKGWNRRSKPLIPFIDGGTFETLLPFHLGKQRRLHLMLVLPLASIVSIIILM